MKNGSKICDYGCEKLANYYFKYVDKYCCSSHYTKCQNSRIKNKVKQTGIKRSEKVCNNISKGKILYYNDINNRIKYSKIHKKRYKIMNKKQRKKLGEKRTGKNNGMFGKISANKLTIEKIQEKYPTFAKIEEMIYEPGKEKEKIIQVHCKNHNCKNSKEQCGWFTPTKSQLSERIRNIEKESGNGGGYLYCLDECKEECPLYNSRGTDPFKIKKELPYTSEEYNIWRLNVLERENHHCEYCDKEATHVHHSRPQKLEPGFVLDPDFGIACCQKCHYKYGHKDECSTGKLASKECNDD